MPFARHHKGLKVTIIGTFAEFIRRKAFILTKTAFYNAVFVLKTLIKRFMSVSLFVTPHIQVQLRAESVSGILPADSRIPLPSPVPCSDDDGYCDDRCRQRKQRYGRCGINIRKCAHNLARAFVFVDRFAYNGIERYRRYSVRNGKNNSSRGFVDKQAYAGTRAAGTSVYQHVSFVHPVYVTFSNTSNTLPSVTSGIPSSPA